VKAGSYRQPKRKLYLSSCLLAAVSLLAAKNINGEISARNIGSAESTARMPLKAAAAAKRKRAVSGGEEEIMKKR